MGEFAKAKATLTKGLSVIEEYYQDHPKKWELKVNLLMSLYENAVKIGESSKGEARRYLELALAESQSEA